MEMEAGRKKEERDRVLGDEWLDWNKEEAGEEIREGKRTFLLLSLVVLVFLVLLAFLFWYLVLPRFQLYGRASAAAMTIAIAAVVAFFITWYVLLFAIILSKSNYLKVCLNSGNNLFIMLFPLVMKLARAVGISKDRLSHSFIKVSNKLVRGASIKGPVLVLFPRCLNRDLKSRLKEICAEYPHVMVHTAPGGHEARRIIQKISPDAIVAVACERDLVSGIQDIAPRIPVIGIPNTRPVGPCKNTRIDVEEFRSALVFFCRTAR